MMLYDYYSTIYHSSFSDSVLEPLVPKDEKVEDFVDIKAGDLLSNSGIYKYEILNQSGNLSTMYVKFDVNSC